jgi:uncharacterized protein HemX
MKPLPAFLAALAVSIAIGLTMLGIGGDAFFNTNTVQAANSPAQTAVISNVSAETSTTTSSTDQQIAQLQSLVQQYQDREKQYQSELDTAAQTIKNDESQLASLQQVIQALIDRGILSVDANGNLTLRRTR